MIYQEITEEIIGCGMDVHRNLSPGFQESVCQRAMEIELKAKKESDGERFAQAINCLEAPAYPADLPINFGAQSLQFKRLFNKKIQQNPFQSNES